VTPTRKIFGIGLNKTGTVSLHEALGILGYRSLHWGGPETRRAVVRALEEGRPLLTYLDDNVIAFSDIEDITYNFDLADRQYPGSRFILTVRALDDWLDSRQRHVEYNRAQQELGHYDRQFLEIDRVGWAVDYQRHTARVRSYFADRPRDLLELDITAGAGWQPLCEFLDHGLPDVPFPWKNRSGTWSAVRTP
jgi:Sulfotransferase domain